MKRGDIYYADLRPVVGSEQGGIRPVLIIQNDLGNKTSSTVIVATMTKSLKKSCMPTHVFIRADFLKYESMIQLEQLKTIDKRRVMEKIGQLTEEQMKEVDKALEISIGLKEEIS